MSTPAGSASIVNIRLGQAAKEASRVDIDIRNGIICSISPSQAAADVGMKLARDDEATLVDGRHLIAFAGFVNAHTHSNEMFEQGAYDGDPLEVWLARAYPPFSTVKIPPRWHYLRAMMLAIRSLQSGVTALHDDFLNPAGCGEGLAAVLDAYQEVGLRASVAVTLADQPFLDGLPQGRRLCAPELTDRLDSMPIRPVSDQIRFFHDAWARLAARNSPRLQLSLGPRGPQRCTNGLLHAVADLALTFGTPVHMHLLESRTQAITAQQNHGRSFVRVLDEAGLLGSQLAMNHAVWLTEADIELIAERGARVVHNPLSNFKLSSGLCPVNRLLSAGVEVALGTDGAATGDSTDFLDTLRMASLAHKITACSEFNAPQAHQLVTMATRSGAATMGAKGNFGEIAVGQRADLTLMDGRDLAFIPLHDAERQLCYAATSRAVHTVMVDGSVVFEDGHCCHIDEAALLDEIMEAAEEFRLKVIVPRRNSDPSLMALVRTVVAQAREQPLAHKTANYFAEHIV